MSNTPDTPTDSVLDKLPLPKLEAYYESDVGRYWHKNPDGFWVKMNKEDLIVEASVLGHRRSKHKGEENTPAEMEVRNVRLFNNIAFAGEVAGNFSGLQGKGSGKYLVTSGPELIQPVEGSCDHILKLADRLFGKEQKEYVFGWCKTALNALYKREIKQRQILIMAGQPACGKSFWQNRVLTPILGGRVARPLLYMTGQTTFNRDLIRAEHLLLEDDNSKEDIGSRRAFGASIKSFCANNLQQMHGKGKDAFTLNSIHWMSMSVNDEIEALHIIPPLDESVADKVNLLQCMKAFTEDWPKEKGEVFEKIIDSEIASFIYYLLEKHEIPKELVSDRYGIKHYHHPVLITAINSLAPETELEALIDLANSEQCKNRGKSTFATTELLSQLMACSETKDLARNLLKGGSARLGRYMNRLYLSNPKKFKRTPESVRPRGWIVDWSQDDT